MAKQGAKTNTVGVRNGRPGWVVLSAKKVSIAMPAQAARDLAFALMETADVAENGLTGEESDGR